MDTTALFQKLGIIVLLGLLVGLQRERTGRVIAGFRTFPIIGVWGCLCGLLAESYGGWVVAAGVIALAAAILVVGAWSIPKVRRGDRDEEAAAERAGASPVGEPLSPGDEAMVLSRREQPGVTTEIAALVMFGLGAYVIAGEILVAVAVGAGMAILLYLKEPLHAFAQKLGEHDAKAIMQFALISMVILPVLPNKTYGLYDVFNPFETWLMVVLIVGISLLGYLCLRLYGASGGSLLGGFVGGLISTVATTMSFSRKARGHSNLSPVAANIIIIASALTFARMIVDITIVAPGTVLDLAPPLLVMFIVMAIMAAFLYRGHGAERIDLPKAENPAEMAPAVIFGICYAVIKFAVAAAQDLFGSHGLYLTAAIAGFTDVDAPTLSIAQLVKQGRLTADMGWQLILIASLTNELTKAGIVCLVGSKELWKRVLPIFGISILGGIVLLVLRPF